MKIINKSLLTYGSVSKQIYGNKNTVSICQIFGSDILPLGVTWFFIQSF